jgi:hypothetical protein
MKSFLIETAFTALRWYVSSGIFDRVAALVTALIDQDIPGEQKREKVIQFFEDEYGLIWGAATNIVLDAVIALTRLKFELSAK